MNDSARIRDIETRANDMILAITNQRNAALNGLVQLEATLAAKQREVDELRAQLDQKSASIETPKRSIGSHVANGHDDGIVAQ